MKRLLVVLLLLVAAVRGADSKSAADAPVILISLDGFRWDYTTLFPDETPTLRRLRAEGAGARALIPVFPSNTFPNHYSIVTGLYPAHHGIINNDFFDPNLGAVFRYNQPNAARDPRWWGGEPIWVTAIKQGRKAAASFWVGSETEVDGVRPTFWRPFDGKLPFETRLEEFVGWMKLPPAERPSVVTIYFEEVNGAGHRFGPTSPEVKKAVQLCDERIATLLSRLRAERIEPNLVIVSDHGMTATSIDRVVILEDYIERNAVQVDAEGSAMSLRPISTSIDAVMAKLKAASHVKVFRAEDLPAHFHLSNNPRIAPIWVVPDEGWHFGTRAMFDRLRNNYREKGYLAGDHGYDPALPTMQGILIAHGPSIRRGAESQPVENVHVYNLLCALAHLTPARNDGDDRLAEALLQR